MTSNVKKFSNSSCKAMGNRIQEARKSQGMKQIELAGELEICVDQMSNIENGRAICKTEYVYILEQVLGVSATFLLHGKDEEKEQKELLELLKHLSPDQINRSIRMIQAAFL